MEIKLERKTGQSPSREQLLELYADAGWTAYTRDLDRLERAVRQSLAVYTAWDGDRLAGLIRAVGDGETILYVQDILVHTRYQRQGIGRALLERLCGDFAHVRQKVLLTDDTHRTTAFYRACGWTAVGDLGCVSFVKNDRSTKGSQISCAPMKDC